MPSILYYMLILYVLPSTLPIDDFILSFSLFRMLVAFCRLVFFFTHLRSVPGQIRGHEMTKGNNGQGFRTKVPNSSRNQKLKSKPVACVCAAVIMDVCLTEKSSQALLGDVLSFLLFFRSIFRNLSTQW